MSRQRDQIRKNARPAAGLLLIYDLSIAVVYDLSIAVRFLALQEMGNDDMETVLRLVDAMIVQHRARSAVAPVDRQSG